MLSKCVKVMHLIYKYAPLSCLVYILFSIAAALITTLNVFVTENLVTAVENMVYWGEDIDFVILFGGLMLISIVFSHVQVHCKTIAELSISRNLSEKFVGKIISKLRKLKYSCFENSLCMDYIRFASDVPDEKLKMCFVQMVAATTSFCSLLGILMYFISISPVIAMIYVAIVILTICVSLRAAKWYDTFVMERIESERRAEYLNKLIVEKDSLHELKIFNSVHYIVSKWRRLIDSILDQKLKMMVRKEKYYFLSLAVMTIYSFLTIIYISMNVINGQFRIGLLVAFISAVGTIFILADQFADSIYELRTTLHDIGKYEKLMELPEINPGEVGDIPDNPDIVFENVSFTYPGTTEEVLHDISFTVSAGEKIAIVGENGAGKSTVVKLMLGLYSPTRGRISVGGISLEHLNQETKQRLFSAVFQDYAQYEISVGENIALAEGNSQSMREKAGTILQALDLQIPLVKGMNTMLGKLDGEGIDLSGGQWQKIAIARGLYHSSQYLILDEPVASLDPISESRLYQDFLSASEQQKGTIIISHRLASARLCSRILVVKSGRIVEDGSHEELITQNGEYAYMYQAQASWYKENP